MAKSPSDGDPRRRPVKPYLIAVFARSAAVDDQKFMVRPQDEQGVVPYAAVIVHALPSGGPEGAQRADIRIAVGRPDDDKPIGIAQRVKRLGAERMALHHFYVDRVRAGLTAEDADQGRAAIGFHIDTGEVVEAVCRAFIDREVLRAVRFDDVAERGKGFPRQRCREEVERIQSYSSAANWPKIRIRLMPPSGKILRRICVIGPISLIAPASKVWTWSI